MEFRNLLNVILLQHLVEVEERHADKINKRMLRDASNPFEMEDDLFKTHFRVSKDSSLYIVNCVRQHLQCTRSDAVPVELKVLSAFSFYGHGSYQKCVGLNFNHAMHQTTISRIIGEVSDALIRTFIPSKLRFPKSEEDKLRIKERFYNKFNLPGVIGAIDCTHISIIAPPADDVVRPGIAYYNRKGYFSLNVQMICDADLRFIDCNARFPGSSHDSGIWSLSAVRRLLKQSYEANELVSSWLIGDSGYPLEPWLLTPVQHANENSPEARFNTAHIQSRNCIERAFGVLKQKFRCLHKHRTLHYDPVKAGKIVYACVVLHNMALSENIPLEEDEDEDEANENVQVEDADLNVLQEGRRVRNELIRRYFN